MAKRQGRGRPKGSRVQKKAKQSANVKMAVLDNPSNELEIDPEFIEEHETGTHGFPLLLFFLVQLIPFYYILLLTPIGIIVFPTTTVSDQLVSFTPSHCSFFYLFLSFHASHMG
jgi:hypothetical protein